MKKQIIIYHAVPTALFVGIVLSFFLGRGPVNAQMIVKTVKSEPVKTSPGTERSAFYSRFAGAATENARSRASLKWAFGSKTQSGWEIYEPLIADTIGAQADAGTVEFAAALSKWQSSRGITATGVVDESTLFAFTRYWQSQRLGRSNFPGDDKLYSAPIADFYDPTRDAELLKLERETYAAYKRMLAAAAKDLGREVKFTRGGDLAPGEKFLRIVSAYRSQEYQNQLRAKSPNSGRAALALHSPHNTGQALDLYVGGEPVTTKDANRLLQSKTPVYRWLVKNARKFGFQPYFYEPWHWEYVGNK
jgi:uncharacterized protein YcbK (DUF882 family)